MNDTKFIHSNGLENEENNNNNNTSIVGDMAVLIRFPLNNYIFKKTILTKR